MNKILLFTFTILLITSCSNDFDLTEDWKDITVAYGLLDQSQAVQYIRVEKAFLDPTTSAITIAQIADSLYYDNIRVELRAFRPNNPGGSIFPLQRVNAEDEGFTREDGIFATSPNYLYKLEEPIDEDFTYRLVITKGDGSTIEAETKICEDFEITSPFSLTSPLDFDAEEGGQSSIFRWNSKTNSKFYNVKMLIEIRETDITDPNSTTNRKLVWNIVDNVKPNTTGLVRIEPSGIEFFNFLANELEPGFTRQLVGVELVIGAGGEALLEYIETGQVNAGITGADLIPTYTNLDGGDAYGIFSSRFYKTFGQYQSFTTETLDSLSDGYRTNDLGF
ncbi:MAG: hypothetical protein AB8G11_04380 [Saprospiraceae bacterium]